MCELVMIPVIARELSIRPTQVIIMLKKLGCAYSTLYTMAIFLL